MTLFDIYLPLFKLVLQMVGDAAQFASYEESRQSCIAKLEQAIAEAAQCDAREEEKAAASFAVIAWLDETVLCSALPWRQLWQGELLQRKYLNTTVAGAHFFTHLMQLDRTHQQARQIFLFCLQNGFHGRYATVDDRSELLTLVEALRRECLPAPWHVWPNAAPVASGVPDGTQAMPRRGWSLPAVAAGALLLYGLLFVLLRFYVA